jgi:hypothetical protein
MVNSKDGRGPAVVPAGDLRGGPSQLNSWPVGQTKEQTMEWTRDLTKGQKRELRRIVALAYERELSVALAALEEQFRRWRAGEIGPHDLGEAIHTFHQGPSRTLWSQYNEGHGYLAAVAAVANGIVAKHEVAADLMEILKPRLADFE